jgi:hypothetical protein
MWKTSTLIFQAGTLETVRIAKYPVMDEKFYSFEVMTLEVLSLNRFRASQNGDIGKHLLCIRKRPWYPTVHKVYASEYTNCRMQGVSVSSGGLDAAEWGGAG